MNGSGVIISGCTEVPLLVAGKLILTQALVSTDVIEVILGNDWLEAHHCIWDFGSMRIRVDGGRWVQLNQMKTALCEHVQQLQISAVTRHSPPKDNTRTMSAKDDVDLLAGENFVAEQLKDPDIGPILRLKQNSEAQPQTEELLGESEAAKIYWSQWSRLTIHNGILCRKFYGNGTQSNILQMIVPSTLRTEAINRCHAGMVGGHFGARKTTDQVSRRFYWHCWKSDVTRFCRRCVTCRSQHRGKPPRTTPLKQIEVHAASNVILDLPAAEGESTNYDAYVSKLDDRLRYAYGVVREQLGRTAERAKRYYDMRVKEQKYRSGQWVSYCNPRHDRGREDSCNRKFTGPFLVLEVLPPVNLKLQRSPHTKPFIVHYDRVKPWTGDEPKAWQRNVSEPEQFEVIELPSGLLASVPTSA